LLVFLELKFKQGIILKLGNQTEAITCLYCKIQSSISVTAHVEMALLLFKGKIQFAHVIKSETLRDDVNHFPQTVPQYLHVA
jgi:hypothetical protein